MSIEQNKQAMRVVNNLFRNESTRKMATQFLQLDHLPTKDEVNRIASSVGVTESSGYKTLRKLKENKLVTESEGSVPLMRMRLRTEIANDNAKLPDFPAIAAHSPTVASSVAEGEEKPASGSESESKSGSKSDVGGESVEVSRKEPITKRRSVDEIDGGLMKVEMSVQGLEVSLDKILKAVNGLKGQTSLPEVEDPVDHTPPRLIEDAEIDVTKLPRDKLEQLVQDGFVRPSLTLQSPDLKDAEQVASEESLRKIIVQVTPFCLLAFDKAREGGFPGNFSDFVNASIMQIYKDRGYALTWTKVDPVSRRIVSPQQPRGGLFS